MKARLLAFAAVTVLSGCATPPKSKPVPPPAPASPATGRLAPMHPSHLQPQPPGTLVRPASAPVDPTPAPMPAAPVTSARAPAKAAPPPPPPPPPSRLVAKAAAPKPPLTTPAAPATPAIPAPAVPAPPVPAPAATASLAGAFTGSLQLSAGSGQKLMAGEVADGLVYYLPQGGAPTPKPGNFTINTQQKGFTPNLLVVPVGSTVSFPNTDTILHNVYSRTPGSVFELGTYGPGETKKTVLKTPGLVIVNCNVHFNMRANIVVLATPYYTRPAKDGSFRLAGLPAGKGTLVFWHPRSAAGTQEVTVGAGGPIVKQLSATKPPIDAHMSMGQ